MSPRVVSAFEWREVDGLYTCNLRLYDHGYTSLHLTPGSKLNFSVQPGRRCIGYHQLTGQTSPSEWKRLTPCPTSSRAKEGPRCPSCAVRDAAAPCLRCSGETCTAPIPVREACENSQVYVYLAAFGGVVKVGVTQGGRFVTRWVEQGADIAMRVLTGNGSEVRRLEHAIHTRLGVSESVRTGAKVSALGKEDKTKLALRLLEDTREKIHAVASPDQRFHEDPWILLSHYNIPVLKQKPISLRVEDGVDVTGEVVGVKGPILLLRNGGVYFALGLSALLGRSVEFTAGKARSQTGLETFFRK
jgi:hypothetical protein